MLPALGCNVYSPRTGKCTSIIPCTLMIPKQLGLIHGGRRASRISRWGWKVALAQAQPPLTCTS